jgi:DNA adenine methylase
MEKLNMKTPISYYGGKQMMARLILPLIPTHKLYCEPFCGGAAIFFAKPKSEIEVLNDTNRELINFYEVAKNDFVALEKEVKITLSSRDLHRKASVIYNHPDLFSPIKRAWALWVLSSQSFGGSLDDAWGFDKTKNRTAKKVCNSRNAFTIDLAVRLQDVCIECADACYIILSRDNEDAFFYCDPPYYNANMGHYDGYSLTDFKDLLNTLSNVKGKFLLSSYPSEILSEYISKNANFCQRCCQQKAKAKNRSADGKLCDLSFFVRKVHFSFFGSALSVFRIINRGYQ